MSGQVITELFQQIFHSEEKIKQRFEDLKKVNQSIQEHQDKIKTSRYEHDVTHGKLNMIRHKLIEEQLQYKWFETRRDILSNQMNECRQEKHKLLDELKDLEKVDNNGRITFLRRCEEFLKEFNVVDEKFDFKNEDEFVLQLEEVKKEKVQVLQELNAIKQQFKEEEVLRHGHDMKRKSIEQKFKEKDELKVTSLKLIGELKHLRTFRERMLKTTTSPSKQKILSQLEHAKERFLLLNEKQKELNDEFHHLQHQPRQPPKPTSSNPWHISKKIDGVRPDMLYSNNNNQHSNKRFKYRTMKRNKTHLQHDSSMNLSFSPTKNDSETEQTSLNRTQISKDYNFDFNINFADDDLSFVDLSSDDFD